jgi:hypothetical protein
MEGAGGLQCLLKVLQACGTPTSLRFGGAVSHGHHLLPAVLLVLVLLVVALLGRGGIIASVTTTKVVGGLRRAWGLMTERVDERLAGRATNEGVDYVSVGDVGDLIVLLGEALNVLLEGQV